VHIALPESGQNGAYVWPLAAL